MQQVTSVDPTDIFVVGIARKKLKITSFSFKDVWPDFKFIIFQDWLYTNDSELSLFCQLMGSGPLLGFHDSPLPESLIPYLSNPSARAGYDTRSILSGV